MNVLHSFQDLQQIDGKKVLALGTFDGIHVGHQQVIQTALSLANCERAVMVLVTFEAHPLSLLRPHNVPPALSHAPITDTVLDDLGVHNVLRLPMTPELLQMSASEFLQALCNKQQVVGIVVGENFTFGAGGKGTPDYMRDYLSATGVQVITEPLLHHALLHGPVSSTAIRQAVKEGRMEDVTLLLGRPYQFKGTVIKGDQRGRTLGFPTLNFLLPPSMAVPPDGVYANRVYIDGQWYDGVGNIGDNPTFVNQYHRCEVHVFGFDRNVYGEEVIVQFISYLRGEQVFSSLQDLIDQMQLDTKRAVMALQHYASNKEVV